eukprot:403336492
MIYDYQTQQWGEILVGYLQNVGDSKKIAFIALPNKDYSCYNPIFGSSSVAITPVNFISFDGSLSATYVNVDNTTISTTLIQIYYYDKLTESFSNYAGLNVCKNILQGKQNELKFTSITTSFTCYVSEPCLINVHTIDMENCRYTQYPIFYAHSWVINATLAELTEVSLQGYYNPTYFTLSGTFMPSFTPTGVNRKNRFYTKITQIATQDQTSNQNLFPTMITMNPLNGLFYVNEGDVRAAGTHYISIYISYISVSNPTFDNKLYDFTLEVLSNSFAINNKAPYFSPAISKQSFIAGQASQYKLGEIVDDENDSVQISIKYDACQKFVTFDDVQNIFTINPALKDKGTYNIVITLKDDNFDSKTNQILFQFDVTFSNFSVSIGEENLTKEEKELKSKTFTSFTSYKILKISNLGIITILFEDQLKVPANYQTKLNRSLDIQLIQQDYKILPLNYSIEEMTSNYMTIRLETAQISNISQTNVILKIKQLIRIGMGQGLSINIGKLFLCFK